MADKPITIAIVDDEHFVRTVLKTVIINLGLTLVGEAGNGSEAVKLYREKKPSLMLMDINMPVKNGDEALQEIRAEFPEAKVIMLTSVADYTTVKRCIALGALNYILKDNSVEELENRLKKMLSTLQSMGTVP